MTKKKERSVEEIRKSLEKQVETSPVKKPKQKPLIFDLKQLGKDCIAKREKDDISLRAIQAEYDISITVMYMIEAGRNAPTATTLAKLIDWLGEPVEKYFVRK